MGLTLPLPDVAVKVIKIVGGGVADAAEVEEVGLCRGQSAEQRQQTPSQHGGSGGPGGSRRRRLDPFTVPLSPLNISLI